MGSEGKLCLERIRSNYMLFRVFKKCPRDQIIECQVDVNFSLVDLWFSYQKQRLSHTDPVTGNVSLIKEPYTHSLNA